jgi:hypothetical protein
MSGSAVASPAVPTVAEVEARLLAVEGPYHVEGRYIADAFLAERARREAAQRIVRTAARRAAYLAAHPAAAVAAPCPWCALPIAEGADAVTMAGDRLHPACAEALEVELWGASASAAPAPTFALAFAPEDDTDAQVIEAETGQGEAWGLAFLAGESVGEQRAERVALGKAA